MRRKKIAPVAIATIVLAAMSGCSASGGQSADENTIEWWHIQTQEPTRGVWQELADEYESANPGTTIEITVQNDPAFKSGLDARLQAGDPPDLFQTWGGAFSRIKWTRVWFRI